MHTHWIYFTNWKTVINYIKFFHKKKILSPGTYAHNNTFLNHLRRSQLNRTWKRERLIMCQTHVYLRKWLCSKFRPVVHEITWWRRRTPLGEDVRVLKMPVFILRLRKREVLSVIWRNFWPICCSGNQLFPLPRQFGFLPNHLVRQDRALSTCMYCAGLWK